jgi:hypothetical protein
MKGRHGCRVPLFVEDQGPENFAAEAVGGGKQRPDVVCVDVPAERTDLRRGFARAGVDPPHLLRILGGQQEDENGFGVAGVIVFEVCDGLAVGVVERMGSCGTAPCSAGAQKARP